MPPRGRARLEAHSARSGRWNVGQGNSRERRPAPSGKGTGTASNPHYLRDRRCPAMNNARPDKRHAGDSSTGGRPSSWARALRTRRGGLNGLASTGPSTGVTPRSWGASSPYPET